MVNENWQRARSRPQVEQRTNEILDAAEKLFRSQPYDRITLQKIAREAEFTLSNIYRYFKSKEEIFLRIYLQDMKETADRAVSEFRYELSIDDFADQWTKLFTDNKRLLELSPLLAVSLERNSSEEVYRNAKLIISRQSSRIAEAVSIARPCMNMEQIMQFLKTALALLSGAWPLSRFTEEQNRIIEELGAGWIKIDFVPFYHSSLRTYLKGLCDE